MEDKDGCQMNRVASKRLKTRKKTPQVQALAGRNAAHSPLLKLPVEIRGIILRMVVGDKPYHLHKSILTRYHSDGDVITWVADEDLEWELKRSLCIHADSFHSVPTHRESTLTSTSAEQLSTPFAITHRKCTSRDTIYYDAFTGELEESFKGEPLPFHWKFYSGILAASRQIYQEAFPIFWRTSRFCFEEGDALDDFLGRLTENQGANLRHLVLFHHFNSYKQTEYLRNTTRSEWLEPMARERNFRALRNLDCLELHLQLDGDGDQIEASGKEPQLESVEAAFKALEDLRLLQLKRASVTVSYGESTSYWYKELRTGELAELAERFRQRLLDSKITHEDSKITHEDRLKRLTDRAKDLKRLLTNEENTVKEHQQRAQIFQTLADDGRARAGELKNKIDELEALLSRHSAVEIKDFLGV